MKRIKFNLVTIFVFIFFLVLVSYWGVWDGFFQQDEWSGLGAFFSREKLPFLMQLKEIYAPMFQQGLGHFLLWTPGVNFIRYSLFGLNYQPYALMSVILHLFNVWILFMLALYISKSKLAAYIAAVFFAVSATASQSVIWVGTSIPTQLALGFSMMSIYNFLVWLDTNKAKWIWLSVFYLIIAIGFKETALFLFILIPVLGFIRGSQINKKVALIFGFFGISYIVMRFILVVINTNTSVAFNEIWNLLENSLSNFVLIVVKGIAQITIPTEVFLIISEFILELTKSPLTPINGDPKRDIFMESQITIPVLYFIGVVIIAYLIFKLYRGWKQKKLINAILPLFLILSFTPLVFLSSSELKSTFLPSRNLYIPLAAISLWVGLIFANLVRKKDKKMIVLLISLIFIHGYYLREQINNFNLQGQERKKILQEIKSRYPNLPSKVVFYTESDRSYYGLPEEDRILPFQSGLGQTLLVWYFPAENFPKEFLQNRFLWDIKDQGYKQSLPSGEGKGIGDRGFGYFRDIDLLKQALKEYNIPVESVIAFSWSGGNKELIDISVGIKKSLK
ncbi:MAG: hypothetical protein Q7R43_02945 [Candidatus Daviesbacteria bacterium]|nr:hypothetical protein [Candidatus Daviesbacteria bacterium]